MSVKASCSCGETAVAERESFLFHHRDGSHTLEASGDMQWIRWNGRTGRYDGDLIELGQGIPRKMREWGLRRALFDLAYGYTSGFPVRDIIPFALRRLLPGTPRRARYTSWCEDEDDADAPWVVGTAYVGCPVCNAALPATVTAEILNPDDAFTGEARLACEPDMSDIWAHMWAHEQESAGAGS